MDSRKSFGSYLVRGREGQEWDAGTYCSPFDPVSLQRCQYRLGRFSRRYVRSISQFVLEGRSKWKVEVRGERRTSHDYHGLHTNDLVSFDLNPDIVKLKGM